MKHLRQKAMFVCVCILGTMLIVTATSVQGRGWKQFEAQVFEMAEIVVQGMIQGNVTEHEIIMQSEDIDRLDREFSRYAAQCPTQQACEGLRHILRKMKDVVGMLSGGISSLEEGKSLSSLRQAVHNYKSSGGYQGGQSAQKVTTSQSQQPAKPAQKLNFAVGVLYQKGGKGKPIELKNEGAMQSGDHYKIIFAASQPCYVYIFQLDKSNIYGVFPLQNFQGTPVVNLENPIQAGKKYFVPAQDKSFILDERPGAEQIYIMVLRQRDVELEKQYQEVLYAQNKNDHHYMQATQAKMMRTIHKKGIAGIAQDQGTSQNTAPQPAQQGGTASQVSYQGDDGQKFSAVLQRLQECENCVRVITFTHQPGSMAL